MSSRIVSVFGLVAILAVVLVVTSARWVEPDDDRSSGVAAAAATPTPTTAGRSSGNEDDTATTTSRPSIPVLGSAMPLEELDGWLQSGVASLEELRGSVVVLQFWTFGCFNCKNTIPHLQELALEHADDDFEIVGVHSPEFGYEEDPAAIQQAADELGVWWPIALDTDRKNFFGWQGSPAYWPRTYVIDRTGNIRFDHIGEGAYEDLAEVVATLLEAS